jgi:zinc/manganese transport system substrate-binding protein
MKMNLTAALAFSLLLTMSARAKLNVVATLPDFGSIAQKIGGDKVNVTVLARGSEDAHFVDARPSHLVSLNKADVLLEGGAELEVGWLPPLLNNARNRKIQATGSGHIVMANGIKLLEVPTTAVDRSMGDVHPNGNPHFWLDPENGKIMATRVAEVFSKLDPKNATYYQANLKAFNTQLDGKLAAWNKIMEPYRGTKVITYHKSFEYFAERFGLKIIGQLEPKPGIEPSPTHINSLIPRAKESGVKLVIIEPFRPRKTPEYVANQIGAKLVILPEKVGGNEKTGDYVSLFDYDVKEVARALSSSR